MPSLPSTCWSLILAARSPGDEDYEQAWAYLHATYQPLVEGYMRRHAPTADLGEEWAAEFMSDWVAGKLDRATPTRGRFRHYLFGALRHFRNTSYRDRKRAIAREQKAHDEMAREQPAGDQPDAAFDRDFAAHVLGRALQQLEGYQQQRSDAGSPTRSYELVVAYHVDPATPRERPTLAALAERFDLTTKAVERQLDYARRKLRGWIVAELEQLVSDPTELCEEIDLLLQHCAGAFGEL